MDKQHVSDILYQAIIDVSPFAADLFSSAEQGVHQDTFLINLGINSIDYAQITQIVMEKLNVACPLEVFTRTNRISEIVDILYALSFRATCSVPA